MFCVEGWTTQNISGLTIQYPSAGICILVNYSEDTPEELWQWCLEADRDVLVAPGFSTSSRPNPVSIKTSCESASNNRQWQLRWPRATRDVVRPSINRPPSGHVEMQLR
jgi:hypothetical protein